MSAVAAGCVICARAGDRKLIVFENEHWIVRHSNETNIPGYVLIEARRHFLDMSHATTRESATYGALLAHTMSAVRRVVPDCERIYTFSLAEAVPHYHLHVIPRRDDFPRAYKGRGIMQYPLLPAMDESLLDLMCERLRRAFTSASLKL